MLIHWALPVLILALSGVHRRVLDESKHKKGVGDS